MTDFEQEMIRELSGLAVEVRGVKEAVTRQNGNVARVTERVNALEAVNDERKGAERANVAWHRKLHPAYWAGIAAVVWLVLQNGEKLSHVIFH